MINWPDGACSVVSMSTGGHLTAVAKPKTVLYYVTSVCIVRRPAEKSGQLASF